ncbi:MAG: prepilin-type N-terminal cleavage/methylation domain-containing protein [Lachnospiraceae bacterium]|nr:prepilin-type N-terminal cleavage/methylation domain-containing protein [Lachnospiraceae bacterium]
MRNSIKKSLYGNRGFSLVEIMVVIAIMMILVSVAALSFSIVNNANVSKAANSINSSFANSRATCLAKGLDAGTLTIKMINGKAYSYIGSAADGYAATASQMEKITNNSMSFEYSVSANAVGGVKLADGDIKQYAFRPSGTMCVVNYSGTGDPTYTDFTISEPYLCFIIKNKKRGARAFIYPETGRHDIGIWNF